MRVKCKCQYCNKDIVVEAPKSDIENNYFDCTVGNSCNECIPENSAARDGINESTYTEVKKMDFMKKVTGLSITWWITEIAGIILLLSMILFMAADAMPVIKIDELSVSQKITYIVGVFFVWYGLVYLVSDIIKFLRKFITKHTKVGNNYSKEKIGKIREQMHNSTKFEDGEV